MCVFPSSVSRSLFQRSISQPIYILVLFMLDKTSFLRLFFSDSLKIALLPLLFFSPPSIVRGELQIFWGHAPGHDKWGGAIYNFCTGRQKFRKCFFGTYLQFRRSQKNIYTLKFPFSLQEKGDCDHIRTFFIGGKNTAHIALKNVKTAKLINKSD